MKIQRSQIQAISATVLAAAASAVAVYVEPYIQEAPPLNRAIYVVLGAPLLYSCFRLTEILLRRLHYRAVLGEWHYVTISGSSFVDQNFASMRFFFNKEGALHYDVQLYPDLDSLRKGENPRGSARSEALDYEADLGILHILYSVKLYADSFSRRGRLLLRLTRQRELRGEWSSVVEDGKLSVVSRGQMFAARPKVFVDRHQKWLAHLEREGVAA